MSVTLINRKGGRLDLYNLEGDLAQWLLKHFHQLYQRKAIAGYVIRP